MEKELSQVLCSEPTTNGHFSSQHVTPIIHDSSSHAQGCFRQVRRYLELLITIYHVYKNVYKKGTYVRMCQ